MRRIEIVHRMSLFLDRIKPFSPLTHQSGQDPEILKNGDQRQERSVWTSHLVTHVPPSGNSGPVTEVLGTTHYGVEQFSVQVPAPPPLRRQWRTTRSAQLSLHLAGLVFWPFWPTQSTQSFSVVNLLYRFGRIFFFQRTLRVPGKCLPQSKP
jgi:hypothetical protein